MDVTQTLALMSATLYAAFAVEVDDYSYKAAACDAKKLMEACVEVQNTKYTVAPGYMM
jgi:hypothetical protein